MSANPLIEHPHAWVAADIVEGEWLLPLPASAVEEAVRFARENAELDLARTGELPAGSLLATLPVTRALMHEAGLRVSEGRGFVVLDCLPVAELSVPEAKVAAWALFSCIGRIVDQKVSGAKIYDVEDKQVALGYGVRRSITNLAQDLHTDAGWLELTPETIGLFCYVPAEQGGLNQLASLVTVHNRLAAESPAALARLYRDFWWDRQSEHEADAPRASARPIFYGAGERVSARYYEDYVRNGHRLAGVPLDPEGDEALGAMRAAIRRSELRIEFALEPGQLLLVENRRIAHARSAFHAAAGERSRRHYFRIWSRREGGPGLEG